MDENKIKEIINIALSEYDNQIDTQTHRVHHQFIEMLMRREERRVVRWEKIKTQVIGWGIIVVLGAIGTAVASYITHSPTS